MSRYKLYYAEDGVEANEIYEFENYDHVTIRNGWFTVYYWFEGSLRKYGFRNNKVLYGKEIDK